MSDENFATRDRILDAAEELFANHGAASVPIRQIAAKARVELGTLTYHFKKKDQLFEALIARRARELAATTNRRLRTAIERNEAESRRLEDLISALVDPLLERLHEHGSGWRNYMRLVSSLVNASDSNDYYVAQVYRYHREMIDLFLTGLRSVYPHCDEEKLFAFYLFLNGTVLHILQGGASVTVVSEGRMSGTNYQALKRLLPQFFASGFRGMLAC